MSEPILDHIQFEYESRYGSGFILYRIDDGRVLIDTRHLTQRQLIYAIYDNVIYQKKCDDGPCSFVPLAWAYKHFSTQREDLSVLIKLHDLIENFFS